MKTIVLSNFDDLIKYIQDSEELSNSELNEILMSSIRCLMTYDHSKEKSIQILKEFWIVWGRKKERPIFIDVTTEE